MAYVKNISLEVGKSAATPGEEYARVEYDAHFTPTEVELGMQFRELIFVFDVDRKAAMMYETANDDGSRVTLGLFDDSNTDTLIGSFSERVSKAPLITASTAAKHQERQRIWDFGDQEPGEEEYRALVYLLPEVWRAWAWSGIVKKNLG